MGPIFSSCWDKTQVAAVAQVRPTRVPAAGLAGFSSEADVSTGGSERFWGLSERGGVW